MTFEQNLSQYISLYFMVSGAVILFSPAVMKKSKIVLILFLIGIMAFKFEIVTTSMIYAAVTQWLG